MIDAQRTARAAPPDRPDVLATAMLPVLLHELNNTTQYLTALNTLLATQGPHAERTPHLAGLSSAASDVDELGWLLGLAANACGADVLLERRERAGLGPLLKIVRKCLRREQCDLELHEGPWPELATVPAGIEPWRVPWAIGTWLLLAGRSLGVNSRLAWELRWNTDRPELICQADMTNELETTAAHLVSTLPGLAAHALAGQSVLLFAPGWLVRPGVGPRVHLEGAP